jgi:hypothetical protein
MAALEIAYLNNNVPGNTHITLDNTNTIINKALKLTGDPNDPNSTTANHIYTKGGKK